MIAASTGAQSSSGRDPFFTRRAPEHHVDLSHAAAQELLVERYEFKYLVPERLLPAIRAVARTTCRIDRYAGSDGIYKVRSLYFDTSKYDLFRANEREAPLRFKVRARTYPGTSSPIFLEVKNRVRDVIVKTRAAVGPDRWRRVLDGEGRALAELPPHVRRGAVAFVTKLYLHHLEPKILVDYEREAYVSEVDAYGRLTLDRRIQARPCSRLHLDLDVDPRSFRDVDHRVRTNTNEPITVLELKFERRAPAWMTALVRRFELVRASFSKYCYGTIEEIELPGTRTAVFA